MLTENARSPSNTESQLATEVRHPPVRPPTGLQAQNESRPHQPDAAAFDVECKRFKLRLRRGVSKARHPPETDSRHGSQHPRHHQPRDREEGDSATNWHTVDSTTPRSGMNVDHARQVKTSIQCRRSIAFAAIRRRRVAPVPRNAKRISKCVGFAVRTVDANWFAERTRQDSARSRTKSSSA